MSTKNLEQWFAGFSKLKREERLNVLLDIGALQSGDIEYLRSGGLKVGQQHSADVIAGANYTKANRPLHRVAGLCTFRDFAS